MLFFLGYSQVGDASNVPQILIFHIATSNLNQYSISAPLKTNIKLN